MKRVLIPALMLLLAMARWTLAADPATAAKPVPASRQAALPARSDATRRQLLVMLRLPPQHFRPDGAYGGGYLDDGARAARRRMAGDLASDHGLRVRDSAPMPAIGVDCYLMEEGDDAPLARVLDSLAHDPRVAWAQPLADYHGLDAGAPLYPVQPAARDWHLAELHRISTGHRISVAVVDSGVDALHPDLDGQVSVRRNFVDDAAGPVEAHGTAVAGIIAARAGNGVGIAGVAPGVRLMALRACWETGGQAARCNSLTLGKAINYALENGARIINLSLAGPQDRLLQALLDAALARGVTVVGAADPQLPDGGFPASYRGVIAVARGGDRHPPAAAVLVAPGSDIPSCLPGGRWGLVSGSSYAAAHVTGLIALLAELRPRAGPRELRRDLEASSPALTRISTAPAVGTDSIDACAAVARAAEACVCQCSQTAAATSVFSR